METDFGMGAVAKRFLGGRAAAAKRHPFFHRKLVAVGVDQFHFARNDVRAVPDCFDFCVSHGEILKYQIPNPKHQRNFQVLNFPNGNTADFQGHGVAVL